MLPRERMDTTIFGARVVVDKKLVEISRTHRCYSIGKMPFSCLMAHRKDLQKLL